VTHPHLFEISAWPWLERLSEAEGHPITLNDVPAREWDRIAARGFNLIFFMGVWRRSTLGRELALADEGLRAEYDRTLPGWTSEDVVGSPYCISAYEPDARMGGWSGLDRARAELNRRGVGLIVDFVPNHTAFDHPWTSEYPDRYVLGTEDDARRAPADFRRVGDSIIACGRDPYFPPWRDVAQLNVFNADTRDALAREVRAIASHCDGVRCDMAMLVLNGVFERTWRHLLRDRWPKPHEELWPRVIRELPGFLFLAEVYWDLEWTLQQLGFHYTYDKRLLDRLHGSSIDGVRGHLRAEPAFSVHLIRFLENHDEPRSAATLRGRLPAAAALLATLPGMRFYFDGQIEGRTVRTPVQLRRWVDEPVDSDLQRMYERLLETTASPLFHEGEWKLLDVPSTDGGSSEPIIACRWRHADQLALVVTNLGPAKASGAVPVGAELPPGDAFVVVDALSGATDRWTRESLDQGRIHVTLDAGGASLLILRQR
jgi:hypothetical protein